MSHTITMTGEEYDYLIAKAKAEEREACAQLADPGFDLCDLNGAYTRGGHDASVGIAKAIRARNNSIT